MTYQLCLKLKTKLHEYETGVVC